MNGKESRQAYGGESMERELLQVVRAFELPEGEIRIEPFGNGHINRTYAVSVEGEKHR